MSKKFYEAKVLPDLVPVLQRFDMAHTMTKLVYIWAYSKNQARFILEHNYPHCEIVELKETIYKKVTDGK